MNTLILIGFGLPVGNTWKTRDEYKNMNTAFQITEIHNLFISRLIKQRKHFTLPKGQLTVVFIGVTSQW